MDSQILKTYTRFQPTEKRHIIGFADQTNPDIPGLKPFRKAEMQFWKLIIQYAPNDHIFTSRRKIAFHSQKNMNTWINRPKKNKNTTFEYFDNSLQLPTKKYLCINYGIWQEHLSKCEGKKSNQLPLHNINKSTLENSPPSLLNLTENCMVIRNMPNKFE